MRLFSHIQNWYTRYERPLSSVSLIGGFIWNVFVLKRVDLFLENFWIVVHLVVAGVCIILINRLENKMQRPGRVREEPSTLHFWLVTILQFMFGGLLSTYLVFYFRSTTLSVTWPFLLILATAFMLNERVKKHYNKVLFQVSFFYLALFSFTIFFVPIIVNQIGRAVFLLSGAVSIVLIVLFLSALKRISYERFNTHEYKVNRLLAVIFLCINVLYFFNLIPPIPLSLKDAGIYHSISRDSKGNYVVLGEPESWSRYLFAETIHIKNKETMYAYTAIFSPASFRTDMVHEWQKYDEQKKTWVTMNEVSLSSVGGREGGYRTYSKKVGLTAGKWRVNVKTKEGQIVGRLRFNAEVSDDEPVLITETKE
jgi:hypothetical protein